MRYYRIDENLHEIFSTEISSKAMRKCTTISVPLGQILCELLNESNLESKLFETLCTISETKRIDFSTIGFSKELQKLFPAIQLIIPKKEVYFIEAIFRAIKQIKIIIDKQIKDTEFVGFLVNYENPKSERKVSDEYGNTILAPFLFEYRSSIDSCEFYENYFSLNNFSYYKRPENKSEQKILLLEEYLNKSNVEKEDINLILKIYEERLPQGPYIIKNDYGLSQCKSLNENDLIRYKYLLYKFEKAKTSIVLTSMKDYIFQSFYQCLKHNIIIKKCNVCGKYYISKNGKESCSDECAKLRKLKTAQIRGKNEQLTRLNSNIKKLTNQIATFRKSYNFEDYEKYQFLFICYFILKYYQQIRKKFKIESYEKISNIWNTYIENLPKGYISTSFRTKTIEVLTLNEKNNVKTIEKNNFTTYSVKIFINEISKKVDKEIVNKIKKDILKKDFAVANENYKLIKELG